MALSKQDEPLCLRKISGPKPVEIHTRSKVRPIQAHFMITRLLMRINKPCHFLTESIKVSHLQTGGART